MSKRDFPYPTPIQFISRSQHLERLMKYFRKAGIPYVTLREEQIEKNKITVTWGLRQAKRAGWVRGVGGHRFIITENGFYRRQEYKFLGWDDLNGRAHFPFSDFDPGPDRLNKLGLDVEPWKTDRKGPILLVGQVYTDTALWGSDHHRWLCFAAEQLKTLCKMDSLAGREIIFRPHPGCGSPKNIPGIKTVGDRGEGFREFLNQADPWCVVTYNSNSACEAVIEGYPAVSLDVGSMAKGVTGTDFCDVINPPMPDRQVWLNRLSYCQWHRDEMETGEAWEWLMKEYPYKYEEKRRDVR